MLLVDLVAVACVFAGGAIGSLVLMSFRTERVAQARAERAAEKAADLFFQAIARSEGTEARDRVFKMVGRILIERRAR